MTIEEAMARIAELEQENRVLSGNKRTFRNILPVNAIDVAPFLFKEDCFGNLTAHKYNLEQQRLSYAIRSLCFPPVIRMRKYSKTGVKHPTEYPIQLVDMTDEQYTAYSETICECLRAIAKCRETWFNKPVTQ